MAVDSDGFCWRLLIHEGEMNKVDTAIETIRKAESLALKYQDYGFQVGIDPEIIKTCDVINGVFVKRKIVKLNWFEKLWKQKFI